MDNRYYGYNCPPLMNDGRFISSYVRSKVFDQYIRNINNIDSSQDYKLFIQNNGDQIINNLKGYLRENNTCQIEGKCLPVSTPNNFNLDFLNKNLNKNLDWFTQINNNDVLEDTKNIDSANGLLTGTTANQLAKDIFNKKISTITAQDNKGSGFENCSNCYNVKNN